MLKDLFVTQENLQKSKEEGEAELNRTMEENQQSLASLQADHQLEVEVSGAKTLPVFKL